MAIRHKSAQKAYRQSLVRREQNRAMRSRLRTTLRDVRAALESKNEQDRKAAETQLRAAVSLIDKMAQKGIIHANAAGRYKSRLKSRLA